jgi:DNA gyrase/topoisomerase IV subunit B
MDVFFISNPPLYRISNKNEAFYIKDKKDFNNFIFNCISEKIQSLLNFIDSVFFKRFCFIL